MAVEGDSSTTAPASNTPTATSGGNSRPAMARKRKQNKASTGEFDPRRWAHAAFAVAGFAFAWVGMNLVTDLWHVAWEVWPQYVIRPRGYMPKVGGVGLALLVTLWMWRREDYFRFVCETATEVSQIVWPTKAETRAHTVVVVVMTIICSVILTGIDSFWKVVTNWIYSV